MKNIAILGSTGSIGVQTLNIIRQYPDKFRVIALTGNSNLQLLKEQADEFRPMFLGVCDTRLSSDAQKLLKQYKGSLAFGTEALRIAAGHNLVDTVVAAVTGTVGLESVVEAVKSRKTVALANKESLVSGGELVMRLVKENDVKLLPVDSEHSAVWQCLEGRGNRFKRIVLTASGGSFFERTEESLKKVTPQEAVKHPNWSMGRKITVDSSTMMNKGLEIIEARWLFDSMNIDYIIHRESIIHSMVEFEDGAILAQMSNPSMEYPIALALSYPERLENKLKPYAFDKPLTFSKPKEDIFRMPVLAKAALKQGNNAPCILNSANEAAVELFLNGKIGFLDIQRIVESVLNSADFSPALTLETILLTHNYWYDKLMTDYKLYIE